jgi:hypothetical protein
MIANVHPGKFYLKETERVINYAALAQEAGPIRIIIPE